MGHELYSEYTFEEALAFLGFSADAVQTSNVVVLGGQLLFFYDYSEKSKDWSLESSDRFTWALHWHRCGGLPSDAKPRGEYRSNIQVSYYQQLGEPASLSNLLERSSKTMLRDKAIPILFFLRHAGRPQYIFVGNLFFHETMYRIHKGCQTKLDKPGKERVFDLDTRLPERLWFQLTGNLWELFINGQMIRVGSNERALAQVGRLQEGDKISGYLTRYPRDYLHFYFAGSEATIVYSEYMFNLYSDQAFHPINRTYSGNPSAKIGITAFENGPDMLDVWPAEAVFSRGEAIQILEAYIREGRLPQEWQWRAYEA